MALEITRKFALITASGSLVVQLQQGPDPSASSVTLLTNVTGAVLNPGSLTFKIEEVDSLAPGTVIGAGLATGAAIVATGAQLPFSLNNLKTGAVRISWTVVGAGFSAANVNLSVLSS